MHKLLVIAILSCFTAQIHAANHSEALSLDSELPTFHCLGYRWMIKGDDNNNAQIQLRYKKSTDKTWLEALPLHRVEPEAMETLQPEKGQVLYAGSILFLDAHTSYDVQLTLNDPDNKKPIIRSITQSTLNEDIQSKPKRLRYLDAQADAQLANGTKDHPWTNLDKACKQLQAGDKLIILPGTYVSEDYVKLRGSAEHPIILSGSNADTCIIKGGKNRSGIELSGSQHAHIENLHITESYWGMRVISAQNLLIRNCFFDGVGTGIFGDSSKSQRLLILNNHIKGVLPFPYNKEQKTTYTGELRGVDIAGSAHVVAYNTVHGFRDGIDTRGNPPITGVDIHNNDIYDCYDDGIELDFSDQNTRAFYNRITNTGSGLSLQPIHGGPSYAIRNVFYNLRGETYKIHLSPTGDPHRTSGGYLIHNTVVRSGPCMRVWSNEGPGHYFTMYNNLYVGTGGPIEITCPMRYTRLDHNGYFHDGKFHNFAYWNKVNHKTITVFADKTGLEQNGISQIFDETLFVDFKDIPNRDKSSERRIFELAEKSPALNKGLLLPSLNDHFKDTAPDLGALEKGTPAPHYGIR